MNRLTFVLSAIFMLLVGLPRAAHAQLDLPGAGAGTVSVITGGSSVTFDIAQSELGANWATTSHNTARQDCNHLPADEQRACMQANSFRSKWFVQTHAALAAQKGKRTLFSKGSVVPGFEAAVVFGYDFEHDSGVSSPYVGTFFSTRAVKTVTSPSSTPVLGGATEKAGGIVFGLNHYFREDFVIGASYKGSWNRQSPGDADPLQVCAVEASGTTATGSIIRSEQCEDRFVAPLLDDYLQHIRADILKTFGRVEKESFGIVGGISTESRTDTEWTWNFAVGPVLHPKGRPYQTLLAVLVTFTDFTDAADKGKKFKDIVGVGLRLGIPLTGF